MGNAGYHLLEKAKRAGTVDEPAAYLHSRLDMTIQEFSNVTVACKMGCSHCCFCSIYDHRPKACRLAASADAHVCARSCHNITTESIPVPSTHMTSRANYAMALAAALNKADLKDSAYEFSAAIVHALDTPDAEAAWLSGADVFAGVRGEPIPTQFLERTQALGAFAFRAPA